MGITDFSHWDVADTFECFEVEALIVGIDPTLISEGENWKKLHLIHKRIEQGFQLAIENYAKNQPANALQSTAIQNSKSLDCINVNVVSQRFNRKEIARWLLAVGIRSIYNFNTTDEAQSAFATRWPWGNHHTEALGHLEAAALHWWVRYDPNDQTTAPTNAQVSEWLQSERKVSKTLSDAMASILRLDGLPPGPRK